MDIRVRSCQNRPPPETKIILKSKFERVYQLLEIFCKDPCQVWSPDLRKQPVNDKSPLQNPTSAMLDKYQHLIKCWSICGQ